MQIIQAYLITLDHPLNHSIYLSIFIPIYCIYLSIYLFLYLSIVYIYLSFYFYTFLYIYLSFYFYTYLLYISNCLSIFLSKNKNIHIAFQFFAINKWLPLLIYFLLPLVWHIYLSIWLFIYSGTTPLFSCSPLIRVITKMMDLRQNYVYYIL